MYQRVELALSTALTIAALVMATTLVKREFFTNATGEPMPVFEEGWEEMIGSSIRVGPASAPVRIIVFFDLQCPACATFEERLAEVIEARPEVAIHYIHYPLAYHEYAEEAAQVVECADRFGQFEEMKRIIYTQQDSLGIKTWSSFVRDLTGIQEATFETCPEDQKGLGRIQEGVSWGNRIDISGTPTIIVNGWRLPDAAVSAGALVNLIDSIQHGRITEASSAQRVKDVLDPSLHS